MQKIIDEIIEIEWGMFDKVQNVSGRAACQDDWPTFRIMRYSQFAAWDEATLQSYLCDLKNALSEGRNLPAEKYAYMMEFTAPLEFASMKDRLPEVSADKKELIQKITKQQILWQEQLMLEFPGLTGRGRPTHTSDEDGFDTSVETYLIGELSTYSIETLSLYDKYQEKLVAEGRNIGRMTLENTVNAYGYTSLEDAEAALKSKA